MPDLMTIYVPTCKSNVEWECKVPGSKGNVYTVSYGRWGHREKAMYGYSCTCPAFQYNPNKHCKHIEQVKGGRCGWNWELESHENDGKCPQCGGPIQIVKVAV